MDSQKIAQALESHAPSPHLHLDKDMDKQVHKAMTSIIGPLSATLLPAVQRNVLREPSTSYFAENRKQRLGMSLEQLEKDHGGETAWVASRSGLEVLKTQLGVHKRDEGPFVLGSVVSYKDFMIAAIFRWIERTDEDLYRRLIGYDSTFEKHYKACRPWLARDDH